MTIAELAEAAGVSTSTVSRVFSNHPNIKPDVRDKVLAAARKYHYRPKVLEKQKNVVIITPYDSVFPVQSCVDMLLMALAQEFPQRGFRIEILPVNNLERLDRMQFCGAAAIGVEPEIFRKWSDHFAATLVVIDRAAAKRPGPDVYFVHSDEEQGMRLAIHYLYKHGCRRIGCIIHGDPGQGNASIREASIRKALLGKGLPADNSLIHFSGPGNDRYAEITGRLLRQDVDALFCPGGNAGIVESYVLDLFGKKVPDDISLIASEQTFFSRYGVPPQTTITQEYRKIAAAAADVITARLNNEEVPERIILPYTLVQRESVKS